jgi:hypothetical protein
MKTEKPSWVKQEEKKVREILKDMEEDNLIDHMQVDVFTSSGEMTVLSVYIVDGRLTVDVE